MLSSPQQIASKSKVGSSKNKAADASSSTSTKTQEVIYRKSRHRLQNSFHQKYRRKNQLWRSLSSVSWVFGQWRNSNRTRIAKRRIGCSVMGHQLQKKMLGRTLAQTSLHPGSQFRRSCNHLRFDKVSIQKRNCRFDTLKHFHFNQRYGLCPIPSTCIRKISAHQLLEVHWASSPHRAACAVHTFNEGLNRANSSDGRVDKAHKRL